jgi:hypothetical protein
LAATVDSGGCLRLFGLVIAILAVLGALATLL